jgi:phytoene synthase
MNDDSLPVWFGVNRDDRTLARLPNGGGSSPNFGFTGHETDLRVCTQSIRRGSKSFHIASLILPRSIRQAAHALYSFCRHSDDAIDEPGRGPDALARLRQRLDLIYEGRPLDHACDRAFGRLAHRHAIPKGIPSALLDGFAMDMSGRQYQTIAEVKDYAAGVAATVGLMMALIMGKDDRWTLARAADLGIAMQLTNIARDIGEDARNGRLYLPSDWLQEVGIDPQAFLAQPRFSPDLGFVVRRLLAEADHHYALGLAGIEHLPAACRHAIRTAAFTYQDIGRAIVANGYDSVTRRARTSLARKLALMAKAAGAAPSSRDALRRAMSAPADPSVTQLIESAVDAAVFAKSEGDDAPAAGIERLAAILVGLQARTREDHRLRRQERYEKAAKLA